MPGIVLSLIAALVDGLCAALGREDLRIVTKPLVALILAVTAWSGGARYLATGLVAAAIGDELLLRDDPTRFMAGMGAFLVMQICYYLAFANALAFQPRDILKPVALPYLALLLAMLYVLKPYAGTAFVPLALYGTALALMARVALEVGPITAIGGLIFMASDMTLAFAKFYPGFPLPPVLTGALVDGSYFTAQILIVAGVLLRRKGSRNVLSRAG